MTTELRIGVCPSEMCPFCGGDACARCASDRRCDHDVIDRHLLPSGAVFFEAWAESLVDPWMVGPI